MVFFLEIIKDELTPIEYKVAKKVFVEKKDRQQIMKEIKRSKTAYHCIRTRISNKIRAKKRD